MHSNQRISQHEPDQSDQSDCLTSDDGEEDLHGAYPDGGFANLNPESANQSPEPPDRQTTAPAVPNQRTQKEYHPHLTVTCTECEI